MPKGHDDDSSIMMAPLAKRLISELSVIELRTELRTAGQASSGSEHDIRRRLKEYLLRRAREDAELAAADEIASDGCSSDSNSGSVSRSDSDTANRKKRKRKREKTDNKKDKNGKKKSKKRHKKSKKQKKKKKKHRKKHTDGSNSDRDSSSSSSDGETIEGKTYDSAGRLIVTKRKKVSRKKLNKGKRWSDKLLKWVPKDFNSASDDSEGTAEDMNIAHPILKRNRHKLFGQGIGV